MLKRLFSVALFFMPCIGTMWASSNRGLLPTPFYNSVGSIQKVESEQAGDFTELKQVVNECRDWATTATTGFAPNAVAELLDKVTLAEMEIASARASQKVIDGYVSSLQSLLRRAKGTINYSPKKVFPVSANHGFVHPGGIVSQGDIDRTKQLLADGDERMMPYSMASFKEVMASTYIAKLIFDKCRRIANRKLISHTVKELFGWAA